MVYLFAILAVTSCLLAYCFISVRRQRQITAREMAISYWDTAQECRKTGADAFNELLSITKQSVKPLDRFIWDSADMFLGYRPVSRSAAKNGKLYETYGNTIFFDEPTTKAVAVFYEILEDIANTKERGKNHPIVALVDELKTEDTHKYNLLKTAIMSLTVGVWYLNVLDSEDAFETKIPKQIKFNLISAIGSGDKRTINYEDVLNAVAKVVGMKDEVNTEAER